MLHPSREESYGGAAGAARAPQSSMLDIDFAQLSDAGRSREHNEDYIGCVTADTDARVRSPGWLFALADGVGGQACGEVVGDRDNGVLAQTPGIDQGSTESIRGIGGASAELQQGGQVGSLGERQFRSEEHTSELQ